MKELIKEYSGAMMAIVSGTIFLAAVLKLFLSEQGILERMISFWGNGAC